MTPPTGSRGRRPTDEISEDLPLEGDDPRSGRPTPSFAFQAILETQRSITRLEGKLDRLLEDRKEDRQEYRESILELKNSFKSTIDELKAENKEFRKEEFKPLKDEVTNLKIKWARVSGIAAAIGAAASIIVGFIEKKLGG